MRPSVRMPRGFCRPAMNGVGVDCRTHWCIGIWLLQPGVLFPNDCAKSAPPWLIWRTSPPWNYHSNSLYRSLILRSRALLGAFGSHLNSTASHDLCDECSLWVAGVRPQPCPSRGLLGPVSSYYWRPNQWPAENRDREWQLDRASPHWSRCRRCHLPIYGLVRWQKSPDQQIRRDVERVITVTY